jgi:hypothetical protein
MLKFLSAAALAGMFAFAAAITPTTAAPLHQKGVQEKAAKADEFSARRRHRRYHRRHVHRRYYRPRYGYYRPYYRPYYYRPYPYYAYAPAPFFPFGFGFGFGPRYWW